MTQPHLSVQNAQEPSLNRMDGESLRDGGPLAQSSDNSGGS